MNRQIHAPLSWKAEQVGGYPVSITQTLLVSVAAGSSTVQAHARQLCQVGRRRSVNSLHCTPSSALGCLVSGPKHLIRTWTFCRRERWWCSYVIIQNATWGLLFFFLTAIGQNLQYEGRALFPVFIYLYNNICTDFFLLNMKAELTSGMPENTEVILFVCLFCLGIWGFFKKNNQSGIFWYCFKIIIEVFQHFTLSYFLSCGNYLSFSRFCHLMYWYKSDCVKFLFDMVVLDY